MGALTFDALLRSLKQGAPDPVYYLHGDEDVLKDEAIRALVDRTVAPAARDFNVDQRNAADLDPEAFHALVNTPPMLVAGGGAGLREVCNPRAGAIGGPRRRGRRGHGVGGSGGWRRRGGGPAGAGGRGAAARRGTWQAGAAAPVWAAWAARSARRAAP